MKNVNPQKSQPSITSFHLSEMLVFMTIINVPKQHMSPSQWHKHTLHTVRQTYTADDAIVSYQIQTTAMLMRYLSPALCQAPNVQLKKQNNDLRF